MHTPSGSVAVLLFSLSAIQEARRKPMTGSVARNERVWRSLEQLAMGKVAASGLPGFVYHELAPNCSGTFGEQLYKATKAVLDLGYESVICIGNDCPALRPSDLRAAARAVQSGIMPVGADERGGVYLAAFNRSLLTDEEAFISLPWQTASLAQALLDHLRLQV
ncbi:DUF2064 domain-containing protein [Fibrella forsythiae]|uniref:DUF2064 domain-containing protein n=1 Tax=Fibrella forsythiae TaxID=2817061 RepID=A0ABS3JNW7_9BACT|nr:DUF2064 domain-containing protein [Fibrella forsythiae]MBO0951678.1 DUF2064 domain-containing protein [Fibrella forsythiae]